MSKFEWMELETLSNEIAHSQSRLDAARTTKNHGLVRLLQREITEAEERRARVLADITKGLGVAGSARSDRIPVPVQKSEPREAECGQQRHEQVEALTGTGLASLEPADADAGSVADEIVRVVGLPFGKRPFRTHVDPSQDGAEVVNAVADRMRREMYRNIGLEAAVTASHNG